MEEEKQTSSIDLAPLSPHLTSLINSLSLVPASAVPAIVDCVLASSSELSPSQLFSSLLHSLPQSSLSNHILPHTATLCHLLNRTQDPRESLRLLIWRLFVPTLKSISTDNVELIEGFLSNVVSKIQSWELMEETLVPYCLRSVGVGVGMVQNHELAVYEWSSEKLFMFPGTLPLPVACRVLTSLLESGLRSRKQIQREQKLDGLLANLMWDLSNLALGMLMQNPEDRSFSVRLLLPTIFKILNLCPLVEVFVRCSPYVLSRLCFTKKIWECCLILFSRGHLERLDSYSVLSLYFSPFHNMELHEYSASCNISEEFDLKAEKEFWEEIRRGLVDKDACLRKQALHILKISLRDCSSLHSDGYNSTVQSTPVVADDLTILCNGTSSYANNITKRDRWADEEAKSLGVGEVCHLSDGYLNSHERWKVFLLLYEMLEEYGTHLVEAAWTHQISLLFQTWSLRDCMNPVSDGNCRIQMETIEGIFCWIAVLWERGFVHENPQVRGLIMESFFSINWVKYAQEVPRSFVLGPLILGLNDAVHHRDFGVKGIYASRTIQGASNFFGEYSCLMSPSERADLVWSLAALAKREAFGRSGLMTLAFCIASAAGKTDTRNLKEKCNPLGSKVEFMEPDQQVLLSSRASDLLDVLGIVIEKSKQHFNPKYRLQVCVQVIEAAIIVININAVAFDMLLQFFSTMPREFTDAEGPLRKRLQGWLTQSNNMIEGFGSCDTKVLVMKNLVSFLVNFLEDEYSLDDPISFDDEDVDAWRLEAERWVRVLFLVIKGTHHLEPIIKILQNYSSNLSKGDHSVNLVSLKLLILILTLVEEFQIEWRKFASYDEAKVGRECNRTRKLDNSSFLVASSEFEKFIGQFFLIMGKVLSYAKLVSPIFWSVNMVIGVQLPSSIKGKLGGPSQRRLASQTTSCLLQSIVSIRTLASILSWFAQLKEDNHCDSLFTFLWDFSWKIIQHQTHNSETAAELCLGGYEALAYVYKAWSTTLTVSAFDFIRSYNKSHFLEGENIPLLDPLLLNFLHNINDLLANGMLTRSRRAVLMNWKWHCLDSLLSIPFNVFQNGVQIRNANGFFSDSTLKVAFSDIVESLENAGETSVLYILRSVRLVVLLLYSVNTTTDISSGSGVSFQMMQQLVHSSWVLHLSCNKRRVAPIAALLSAVLHHSVFSELRMHDTNGSQQAPLKWFVEKLLNEGVKSPRTIRLAALHLTGLWLSHPHTVKYYIKELKLLSLYGSVAFDEDFEAELSENHEARTEVSLLAQSPDRELIEVFINTELYARVCVAVLFYKLANLANRRGKQENEDSVAARHCGKLLLLDLLDSAVNDKDLAKELYKKYSAIHRRKVRVWQMICILSNFVESDIVEDVMCIVHICLYRNNLPAVRQYLETFVIQVYLKFPPLAEKQLIPIFCDYTMRPQALSSYVFIAANVILHANESTVQIKHLNELLPPIVPFLTSHHHCLRGFTQLLVHYVLCKLWPVLVPDSSQVAPLEKKCFENLKSYLAENVDCTRLRTSMEGVLDAFDPNISVSPAGVFSARNEGSEFECAPISLMDQVITFLNDARNDLRSSIARDVVTIENEKLTVSYDSKDKVEVFDVDTMTESLRTSNELSLDFQKKITIYEHVRQAANPNTSGFLSNLEFSTFLAEMEKEDQLLNPVVHSRVQAMEKIRESQQQIILVASLIDRIPNLAGLARTCEVFRAAGLAVSSASIVQDKQFQLISVTAEKWVPIIEVPVSSMKVFLEKKRREGFSILGLEQTANSTPLDKFCFPNKTVLVLGREKEGIPVEIIHILDACIEIPQLGIIRSLNVHVSGAIALWEYTRQQRSN